MKLYPYILTTLWPLPPQPLPEFRVFPFTVPNVRKIGQDKTLKLPDEKESWVSYS